MTYTIGELFAGYGGLGLGVQEALGVPLDTLWVSDADPTAKPGKHAPEKILAHRFPGVPNLGDITAIDWSAVPPVDIIAGGFPCQDLSLAGRRAGLRPGTRSGLWAHFAHAIDQLRPRYVVAENVRGLLSAEAHSDLEPCPQCVGDRPGGSDLRALGAVLGDLADRGYDAQWVGLPAADVGAPHRRFRVFILATDTRRIPGDARSITATGEAQGGRALSQSSGRGRASSLTSQVPRAGEVGLLPTPRATDGTKGGPNQRGSAGDLMLPSAVNRLLPTPRARDFKGRDPNPRGIDLNEAVAAGRLLPTPTAADAKASGGNKPKNVTLTDATVRRDNRLLPTPMVGSTSPAAHGQISGQFRRQMDEALSRFGDYADAVERWATVIGRPAPDPTVDGRLSPRFVEWMMGLPAGWVTDVPGLSRAQQLKALGNGVVPQQAAAAIRYLLRVAELEVGR